MKTVKRRVKHILSREEKEEKSAKLIEDMRQFDTLNGELADIKADYKKQIAGIDSEISDARKALEFGHEQREVECEVTFFPKIGKKEFRRLDTLDLVATEDMTDYDRQMVIPEVEPEKPFNPALPEEKLPDFITNVKLTLWDAAPDMGVMFIERRAGLWYYGADLKIGNRSGFKSIETGKPAFKERFDAVKQGAKFVISWIKSVEPEAVDGFKARIQEVVEAQREVVE